MICKQLLLFLLVSTISVWCFRKSTEDLMDEISLQDLEDEFDHDEISSEINKMLVEDEDAEKRVVSCDPIVVPSGCPVDATIACSGNMLKWLPKNGKSKVDLQKACMKRAVCLTCGKSKSWKQQDCDDQFWYDAKHICYCKYANDEGARRMCLLDAAAMRNSRMVLEDPSFNFGSSPAYCGNACLTSFKPILP